MIAPVPTRTFERPRGWLGLLQTSAVLLAISLPFAFRLIPVFILSIAVATIALRMQERNGRWCRPRLDSAFFWMPLFYLLHVLGMAWTSNTSFGAFDLQVKASFLVFPALGWVFPSRGMEPSKVFRTFAWANAGAVVLCLLVAIWNFGHEYYLRAQGQLPADPAWTNHFFESRFALFLHPSYMAMYLCFALATVQQVGLGDRVASWVKWAVPGLLIVGVILCNSKMGWLTVAVVIGGAMLNGWKDVGARKRLILLSGVGLGLFLAVFLAFPTVSGKLTQAISATGAIDPASDQSSALRRMVWDAATDLFREHPLTGVGTGDIKDELIAVYQEKGYVHAEAKRMNAHSQYLQTAATLGILGLLVLVAMVLVPLYKAYQDRDRYALVFWLIIALNWSVESMAEVQAGVLFAAFIAWVLRAGRA